MHCLPKKSKTSPNINGNPADLANKFNAYFTSVGASAAQKALNLAMEYDLNPATTTSSAVSTHEECPVAFQFQAVTEKEAENVVKGLSSNKAPGHDKITTRVLKACLPVILPVITSIMIELIVSRKHGKWLKLFLC